jgi:hypothetical protein
MTTQKPEILPGNNISDYIEIHPAYAQISASRVSGHRILYQSEFKHQHFITISIKKSELHRSLNRGFPLTREEYIEVSMSEAQWATFISSLNSGCGSPCTLSRFNGEFIPGIEKTTDTKTKFKGETKRIFKDVLVKLKSLKDKIEQTKLPNKTKSDLISLLNTIGSNLISNFDFMAKSFDEHIENTVESAKVEIEAHIQHQIVKAGLESLSVPLLGNDSNNLL